jgi:hypothetical protein
MKINCFHKLGSGLGLLLLVFAPRLSAQQQTPKSTANISGVWVNLTHSPGFKGKQSEWTTEPLPFTPKGLEMFQANHPGKSPRGFPPDLDNDPIRGANPTGLYRTLIYFRSFELVQLPDKVIQMFAFGKNWRTIYTDGRPVPDDVAAGPYWYGYSVGKWQGDALVATTLALDERAWMDEWGTPFSAGARIEERWQRISPEKLQLTLTVNDPEYYTKPWISTPLIYTRVHGAEPEEIISARIDEKDFDEHLRAPAAGIKK